MFILFIGLYYFLGILLIKEKNKRLFILLSVLVPLLTSIYWEFFIQNFKDPFQTFADCFGIGLAVFYLKNYKLKTIKS